MTIKTGGEVRTQTMGEEIANSLCHGFALLASIAALPVLVVDAVGDGGGVLIVGASVFGTTMLLLYLTSTIYHALPLGKGKCTFLVLDHCAIFLLIAGTYTPFTLGALHGPWGWSLFGVMWGLAIVGILLKAVFAVRDVFSTTLYLIMGWLVVIAIHPLLNVVPIVGLLWLLAGGLAYTLGVVFYVLDSRIYYGHFVWHLFVVIGSTCHFVAVLRYAA